MNEQEQIKQLQEQLVESQAREAVMRHRLEELLKVHSFIDNEEHHQTRLTQSALATDSGKSFLAQFREMRTALEKLVVPRPIPKAHADLLEQFREMRTLLESHKDLNDPTGLAHWMQRRDAVLEATKGLV